jgi:hypothetical protein
VNRLLRGHYSSFIAFTDSFANPHLALPFFGYSPRLRSLCRLLPAPAASGTFPTLCCESFLRCLSPYPGGRLSAFAWFFLNLHRPSPSFDWVDFPASFREHDFSRVGFRGCSYFVMFRVAVGTTVTRCPPHSPVLAQLAHTVLTLDVWRRSAH